MDLLALASAATAWLSLPFLVAANALLSAHPSQIWAALGMATGDWDEPIDPGLTVYPLLAGALVALLLAHRSSRPRVSLAIALLFAAPAALLVALGAHLWRPFRLNLRAFRQWYASWPSCKSSDGIGYCRFRLALQACAVGHCTACHLHAACAFQRPTGTSSYGESSYVRWMWCAARSVE